jgi:hypothetical protein
MARKPPLMIPSQWAMVQRNMHHKSQPSKDPYATKLSQMKQTDVSHLPSGKFNLFSLKKMQKEGWLLNGNQDAIWLTKGDNTVIFDM